MSKLLGKFITHLIKLEINTSLWLSGKTKYFPWFYVQKMIIRPDFYNLNMKSNSDIKQISFPLNHSVRVFKLRCEKFLCQRTSSDSWILDSSFVFTHLIFFFFSTVYVSLVMLAFLEFNCYEAKCHLAVSQEIGELFIKTTRFFEEDIFLHFYKWLQANELRNWKQ